MTDMRTPLKTVRGLGAAKDGAGHFWQVRLSSLALLPLSLFMIGWTLSLRGASYAEVRAALAEPLVALAALLFILISLDHMRLGMQVIIEDYIPNEFQKVVLLMLNTFFTVIVAALCLFAVLKLGFAG